MKTMLQISGFLTLALVLVSLLLLGCNAAMKSVDIRWAQIAIFVLAIIFILIISLAFFGASFDVVDADTGVLVTVVGYFSLMYLLCFLFPSGARWLQENLHPWLLKLLIVLFSILSVLCFVSAFIALASPEEGGWLVLGALIPMGITFYCIICTHPVVFEHHGLYGLRQSHQVNVLIPPVYDSIVPYQLQAPLIEQSPAISENEPVNAEVLLLYQDRKIFVASVSGDIWGEYIADIALQDSTGTFDIGTVRRLFESYKKKATKY